MSDRRNSQKSGISKENLKKGQKKLLALALAFLIEVAIYVAILKTEFLLGYILLYVTAGVLAVAVFLFSGAGVGTIPSKKDLRDDWSDEKKTKFISFLEKGQRISAYLQIILVPLLFIIGFDFVKLTFFE